jgi:predicted ArsR family transcriptional regulator
MTLLHAELLREKLAESAMSFEQMANTVNLSKAAVQRWAKSMREAGRIYVESYGPDVNGRPFVPLHRWGTGVNAERPGHTVSDADRMRAKRAEAAENLRKNLVGMLKK